MDIPDQPAAEALNSGRPAATLVIVRDRPGRQPDLLMLERASTMAFAASALVFPGGAVDPADHVLADSLAHGLAPEEAAARIAAIRESIEECGIAIGLTGAPDPAMIGRIRHGLAHGERLGDLLAGHGLSLALDALTPFARWHPSAREMARRVYDTRFYLARAPQGQEASVDATENVHLFWSGAAETLARCDAGQGHVIFPTRRNLERLAMADSHAALVAHAAAFPVEKIRPWIEERDGEAHLCIPDHLGYPVTSEPMQGVRRG